MNKLLLRQLQKTGITEVPENFTRLLGIISESYDHFEKDRRMMERSVEISSKEMIELNTALKTEQAYLKKAHKELEASVSILEATIESTADGILVADFNGNVVRYNNKFKEMWQVPAEILEAGDDNGVIEYAVGQLLYPEEFLAKVKALYLKHDEVSFDVVLFKDGREFERYSQPQVINGKCVGRVWSFRDVTESRKSDAAIKESNQRYRYVSKATSDAIWDWNFQADTIYWGEGFRSIFGYVLEQPETPASFWTDRIHPEDYDRVMAKIHDAIDGNETNWRDEYRFRKEDNSYAYVLDKGFIIRDQHDAAIRMVGAIHDFTKRKNDEFDLQQSEARHRGIIASQTNYVVRTDLSGNYTYYNDKFMDDFGWIHNSESLMGKNIMSSVMDYHHDRVKEITDKCFAGKNQVFQVEIDKPCENGTVKTTLWDFICLTDSNGLPTEIQCVGIDISDRKKAERAYINTLEEKNIILESIDDGFYAFDKNWTITYWNKQAEKLTGLNKNDVIGRNFWDATGVPADSICYERYHRAINENVAQHYERHCNNQQSWQEVSAYPSDNGLSVYFKDITEAKKSAIQLGQLNEELKKHAKELVISNAELEQFAYVASHDLQEPLRMVTSFLTQLDKKYGTILDDKGKRYISFAVDGAKRMRQIILDLLEFSRVGQTDDDREDLSIDEIVKEIQILFRKRIEEQKAIIRSGELPVIGGYKTPVRQIFQNIISNALKYSRPDVPPQISISAQAVNGGWQFAIADNGIGIAKEYFDNIFIIFKRLHNQDEYSGTGMGLAVTKKIVENLGGKIWLDSTEGKGSTFYFTIPADQIPVLLPGPDILPHLQFPDKKKSA